MAESETQICARCGKVIDTDSEFYVCSKCSRPYHFECWESGDPCMTAGCDGIPIAETLSEPDSLSGEPVASKVPLHTRFMISLRIGVLGKLIPVWALSLAISIFVVWVLQNLLPGDPVLVVEPGSVLFYTTMVVSLVCMYVDSTLGMGYGTTLTPILLLMGYDPLEVVPALLVTQWLAGISAGVSHQSAGNIDLSASSIHFKVSMVLAACGIVGTLAAVEIAVNIEQNVLMIIIGAVVLIVGLVIFLTRGKRFRFSWRKIILLGFIASFNKGLSAGGYGPIVTGGQILSGVGGKQAIGVTALSEGLTCLIGTMAFLASGEVKDLSVSYPLVIGAVCSVPLSAYTVRKITIKKLTTLIGLITIILGAITVIKAVFP